MLKKTYTYEDYKGAQRTEDFYFDFSEAEVMEMELSTAGGFAEYIETIVKANDSQTLFKTFKELILKAYGEKSADGREFVKSEKLSIKFSQTKAYSMLLMELVSSDVAAVEFFKGVIPKKKEQNNPVPAPSNIN